jgi:hypothetical protein
MGIWETTMSVGKVTKTNSGMVIRKEQNTIYIDEQTGVVTKKLGQRPSGSVVTIVPEWFEAYKVFQNINPYVVKVKELKSPNTFTMEYVPNLGTVDQWLQGRRIVDGKYQQHTITRLELFELTKCIMSVIPSSIEMSKVLDHSMWVHTDMHIHNIVCVSEGDNPQFKMIDPDSWSYSEDLIKPDPLDQIRRMNTMITNVINDRENLY